MFFFLNGKCLKIDHKCWKYLSNLSNMYATVWFLQLQCSLWKFNLPMHLICMSREEPLLKDIQPTELHEKLQDLSFTEEAQLIDVREPEEV